MEQQDRIDQLVAENQELLALTKQAFVKREVEKESVPVDEEWEKFATEHAEELEALEKDEPRTATITRLMGILPYKVAASIIGILFTAGVAFAAIHIVRHYVEQDMPTPPQETQMVEPHQQIIPDDTVKVETTDTIVPKVTMEPVVFDNVPLEEMLPEIAAHYDATVSFGSDKARQLRFRFVWNPQQDIDQVVCDLKQFESLTVTLKDNQITVE